MTPLIRIDVCALPGLSQSSQALERKAQIAARKSQIAALCNQLLSSHLGYPILDQAIARSTFGKPYLLHSPAVGFNHSHSQHFYALAFSQHIPNVGVDIEELSRKVRFEALAQHAFHPQELKQWYALDADPEYWFKVWTTKEAVLKASGLGIRINLNELNTQVNPHQDTGQCTYPDIGSYAYQSYQLAGCMLTVAWQSEPLSQDCRLPLIQIHQSV